MRASLTMLPLFALLAAGCERMPEDPVFMYGRLMHADGSPAVGTPVRVERAMDTGDYVPGTPYSLEEKLWEYAPYLEGTSEADGYFTLEALAGDLYSDRRYLYRQHRFRVYPPLAEDGHGVFVSFFFRDDVDLPLLQPWASGFAVSDGPERPALTFAPAPPVPELPLSATLPETWYDETMTSAPMPPTTPAPVVQLHGEGGLVWQQAQATSPWTPSPYVLEDFSGVEAQVRAATLGQWYFEPLGAQFSDLSFRMEWRSPRKALPAGGLRPVSRGAGCPPLAAPGACPFTDGKLTVVETQAGTPQPGQGSSDPGVEALTLTLDAPARPRRLVVRGLETTIGFMASLRVVLEGSADGANWAPLADVVVPQFDPTDPSRHIYQFSLIDSDSDSPFDGPMALYMAPLFIDAPITGETDVRHVRLRVTSEDRLTAGRVWKLGELSLFE